MTWYHGGIRSLEAGDLVVPSPPHVTDGCPVCVARASGQTLTVGEYRRWALSLGPRADRLVQMLEGLPDDGPIDPPSQVEGVYLTTHVGYATWYAARSGHGDLYEVVPVGDTGPSMTDHFPTIIASAARVVRVLRREVYLTRAERRQLDREWRKRDEVAAR